MRQALNHSYRFPQRAESVRTLCIRLPKVVLFLFLLLGAGSLAAQNTDQQIAAQKRLIADLEKQIAREEQEISKLKKGRASAEETVRRLARQIDSRNQLLDVTERDARKLEVEVARTDSVARGLSASLDAHKRRYAEMVREAYRNYKHNNYLTYLFSSSDFNQVARRITNLREVAAMRERQMEQIVTLASGGTVTEFAVHCDAPATTTGTLKIGMECAYEPYNWTDTEGTSLGTVPISSEGQSGLYANGYDVQIAQYVANRLGLKLEIYAMEWDSLIPAVNSGAIDAIVAGMSPTAERSEQLDFTDTYYESNLVVIIRK